METVRKSAAGTNNHPSAAAAAVAPARKLDETTEPAAVERVGAAVAAAIRNARIAKGWTQKELAARINVRPSDVQDYESGRAVPSQAVLVLLERVLGVKLRAGKDVGAPLAAGGGK